MKSQIRNQVKYVLLGESKHCFLHKDGTPVVIPGELPEFYEALKSM